MSKMYIDWSKIFGVVNGEYYRIGTVIGGRGTGKTYGVWHYILTQHKLGRWGEKAKLFWLRSTDEAVDGLKMNFGRGLCPYENMQNDFGVDVYVVGENIYIRKAYQENGISVRLNKEDKKKWNEENPGLHIGYVLSVLGFYKDKGRFEENATDLIIYDEVQREEGERKQGNLGYAFVNVLETISRKNRKTRVLLLSNLISDASEVLDYLKFKPSKFGRYKLRGHRTCIWYLPNSEEFDKVANDSSLSRIFSKGYNVSSIVNKVEVSDDFKPVIKRKDTVMGTWMFRLWFNRNTFYDVYSFRGGIYITISKDKPGKLLRQFSCIPADNGIIPYSKDAIDIVKLHIQKRMIAFSSSVVASAFISEMKKVTNMK